MARQVIGSIWDRVNRNGINANFEELYADIGLATGTHKTLEEFLNGVGVVGSTMLKTNSVYGDIIREKGVGTRHLLEGTVTEVKLADESVTTNKVKNKSITNIKIADNSVSESNLADESVTTSKLANGVVENDKVSNEAISPNKTTFLENKLIYEIRSTSQPELYKSGVILNASDGIVTRMVVNTSSFSEAITITPIKVNPNRTYELVKRNSSDRFRIAFFDHEPTNDSVPTHGYSPYGEGTMNFNIDTKENDQYMAIQITSKNEKSSIDVYESRVSEGQLSYLLDAGKIKKDKFGDGTITPSKTTFIDKNLSQQIKSNMTDIYKHGYILNTSGTEVTRMIVNESRFPDAITITPIELEQNSVYQVERLNPSDRLRVALFDHKPGDGSVPIRSIVYSSEDNMTFDVETDNTAVYLAIQVSASNETPSLNIYKYRLNAMYLPSHFEIDDSFKNRYLITGEFGGYYQTIELDDLSRGELILQDTDMNYVYGLYNDLMAEHPSIISRKTVGYGGDYNGEMDNSLPIYEYTIHVSETLQETIGGTDSSLYDAPTILITTGVHGREKAAVYGGYQFINQIINNPKNDERLYSLKNNFNFKIIPLVNPGGYNETTRNNLSDVNINRDFMNLTQIETQVVDSWLEENRGAFAYLDFHNFSRTAPARESSTTAYHLSQNNELDMLFSSLIRRLSDQWREKYLIEHFPNTENVAYGYIESNHYRQTHTSNYGAYHNHNFKLSAIPEASNNDPADNAMNTKTVLETNAEMLINYVLTLVDIYKNK